MQLFKKTNIDFIGKRYYAFAFSAVLLLSGIVSLVVKGGPKLGIDFTGGTLVQLGFQTVVPMSELRVALAQKGYPDAELQDFQTEKSVIIRVPKSEKSATVLGEELTEAVRSQFVGSAPIVQRAESVGPAVGRALTNQALSAIIWATILIIIYVGFRFRSTLWGVCSIAALLHDVLSVVGIFSIMNKEISVTVVAGILTLAGYSMNDTIVIYDRMRENIRLSKKETLAEIINRSVNETLSRTIMTSMTVAITVLVLFLFGGSVIHDFAFALLWGVFVGSYSSIFVAAPIIYEWQARRDRKRAVAIAKGVRPGPVLKR
ncbi:MAG: protein translocase subunit SecF [Elusimicrobiota bacterium]|jgi:preprotein translocase subunit SecF